MTATETTPAGEQPAVSLPATFQRAGLSYSLSADLEAGQFWYHYRPARAAITVDGITSGPDHDGNTDAPMLTVKKDLALNRHGEPRLMWDAAWMEHSRPPTEEELDRWVRRPPALCPDRIP